MSSKPYAILSSLSKTDTKTRANINPPSVFYSPLTADLMTRSAIRKIKYLRSVEKRKLIAGKTMSSDLVRYYEEMKKSLDDELQMSIDMLNKRYQTMKTQALIDDGIIMVGLTANRDEHNLNTDGYNFIFNRSGETILPTEHDFHPRNIVMIRLDESTTNNNTHQNKPVISPVSPFSIVPTQALTTNTLSPLKLKSATESNEVSPDITVFQGTLVWLGKESAKVSVDYKYLPALIDKNKRWRLDASANTIPYLRTITALEYFIAKAYEGPLWLRTLIIPTALAHWPFNPPKKISQHTHNENTPTSHSQALNFNAEPNDAINSQSQNDNDWRKLILAASRGIVQNNINGNNSISNQVGSGQPDNDTIIDQEIVINNSENVLKEKSLVEGKEKEIQLVPEKQVQNVIEKFISMTTDKAGLDVIVNKDLKNDLKQEGVLADNVRKLQYNNEGEEVNIGGERELNGIIKEEIGLDREKNIKELGKEKINGMEEKEIMVGQNSQYGGRIKIETEKGKDIETNEKGQLNCIIKMEIEGVTKEKINGDRKESKENKESTNDIDMTNEIIGEVNIKSKVVTGIVTDKKKEIDSSNVGVERDVERDKDKEIRDDTQKKGEHLVVSLAKTMKVRPLSMKRQRRVWEVIEGSNTSQLKAVDLAMSSKMTLIQGPPGTGKTGTAAGLIKAWCHSHSDQGPVLAVAHGNVAVDQLMAQFLREKIGPQECVVVRLGNPNKIREDFLDLHIQSLVESGPDAHLLEEIKAELLLCGDESDRKKQLQHKYRRMYKECAWGILSDADVIFATVIGSGDEILQPFAFDMILLDEASMCSEAAALVPLRHASKNAQIVLVGDHQQLPPFVQSRSIEAQRLGVSLFQRLMEMKKHSEYNQGKERKKDKSMVDRFEQALLELPRVMAFGSMAKGCSKINTDALKKHRKLGGLGKLGVLSTLSETTNSIFNNKHPLQAMFREVQTPMLETQYRMHPDIADWPSKAFYYGRLKDGIEAIDRPTPAGFPVTKINNGKGKSGETNMDSPPPLVFIEATEGEEKKHSDSITNNSTSFRNPYEVEIVVEVIKKLLAAGEISRKDIGIVTPYSAQRRLLDQQLTSQDMKKGKGANGEVEEIEINTVDGYQ
eukprot:Ihof_evm4s317 gene=Ihof_evmTU4s317